MRYYIADCHFYHRNLLTEMDSRGFKSVEQMNEVMIEKWNKKVHAHDEVVILGDLSLGSGQETNQILHRLKGKLYLIRGNHDDRYLKDKDFDVSRFVWIKDYAEIHDNKRKIVLMHYPIFCYNGQFRRGPDGTPLTYMLHGHIHKTEDQKLVDKFCAETRATMRKSAHQEVAQQIPYQMINCFCMYSDYTPLTLEEWVECDKKRRNQKKCSAEMLKALEMFSDDFMSDRDFDSEKIRKAAEAIRLKARDIARGNVDYTTYEEVFGK